MARDRGTTMVLGLAIMLFAFLIGYKIYIGITAGVSLDQIWVFIFLAIMGYGIIKMGTFAGKKEMNAENFIILMILIVGPIAILYILDEYAGISLFSIFGATAAIDIDLALRGSVVEWIKNNLAITSIVLVGLYLGRKRIGEFWRHSIKGK